MPRKSIANVPVAARILDTPESSVLDLLDRVLNKGVLASGDVVLGVAGVDLIYVKLSALLCAADRVLPTTPRKRRHRAPHRRLSRSKPTT
ncbi:MAG TPA: gas vesicle protein [Vicinamibacterales bacterium]|jgi:hypothetical protein